MAPRGWSVPAPRVYDYPLGPGVAFKGKYRGKDISLTETDNGRAQTVADTLPARNLIVPGYPSGNIARRHASQDIRLCEAANLDFRGRIASLFRVFFRARKYA